MTHGTVYIVDDDEAVRDSLSILLESHGIAVKAFESCPELLGELARNGHDRGCLLLDLHLPEMSGLDLLERYPPEKLGMPVVMISGRADPAVKGRALSAGVEAVIDKPFSQDHLLAVIASAMRRRPHGVPARA